MALSQWKLQNSEGVKRISAQDCRRGCTRYPDQPSRQNTQKALPSRLVAQRRPGNGFGVAPHDEKVDRDQYENQPGNRSRKRASPALVQGGAGLRCPG